MISILLIVVILIGYSLGLYKWFEKAGEDGWKAFVPGVRTLTWTRLVKKPSWWVVLSFIPVVNVFLYAHLLGETSDSYRRYSFWEHTMAILFGWLWLPYLGFKQEEKYHGVGGVKEGETRPKRSKAREWADALIFAIFAAYFIRTFTLELYTIPTSSMEGTLKVGDFLFVSKFHYGARVPQTPIAFPLVHHSFPQWIPFLGGKKAYLEWIKLPYNRLPALQDVKRNDMVVFNFPANDTTTKEWDSRRPYYDLIREKQMAGLSYNQARQTIWNEYTVISRPVDKRENYIKRCVGIPGDTLQIIDGILHINADIAYQPDNMQYKYYILYDNIGLSPLELLEYGVDIAEIKHNATYNYHEANLSESVASELELNEHVLEVIKEAYSDPSHYDYHEYIFYPHHKGFQWNWDNYGPIVLPEKGMTIPLNAKNYWLYKRCITVYEGNALTYNNTDKLFYVNGVQADTYTFSMGYYWMMGDNRHASQDSRFWGFVPEDHIVGKAWFVLGSLDRNYPIWKFWKKIRWNRFFASIHNRWAPDEEMYMY